MCVFCPPPIPPGNKSDRVESGTSSALGQFVMATATPFLGNAMADDPDDSWVSARALACFNWMVC